MEFKEYFMDKGFKVTSTAKQIRKATAGIRKEPGSPRKYLKNLKFEIEDGADVADTWDAAKSWLEKHAEEMEHDIKFKYEEDVNCIASFLDKIADEKEKFNKKKAEEDSARAPVTADYTIYNLDKSKEAVELFNALPVIKANAHDKDLMKCFAILGDAPVFRSNGICRRLMTKTTGGSPQVVFSAGDAGADGLYTDIVAAMSFKYERMLKKLQSKVTEVPEFSGDDDVYPDGKPIGTHPLEDIFVNEVPTIFRHIVDIRKTYKKIKGDDGKDIKKFLHYRVYAKKTAVQELTVDAFVEWLSSHWMKATRGVIDKSASYKVFTNDPGEMAVSHFVIWPREEWENAEIPKSWNDVFGSKASPRLLERLFFYTGSLLDANNSAQQYLANSDEGQTGKSLYNELLQEVLCNLIGTDITIHLENSVFKDGDRFGLSSAHVWNYRLGIINEYDGKSLNSGMGKGIVGGDTKPLEIKNLDSIQWDTKQFRLIAPSNHGFVLKSHAVRRRCIPITFKQTHSSMENMNDEDKRKLIADGEAFMKYCWRVYQTSKFRQRDGGYFVACPEDEKLFLEGKFFVPTGDVNPTTGKPILKPIYKDKTRMLRAFSRDPEISAFYTVDDYEDTEMTCSFNDFIDKYCDVSDDDKDNYTLPFNQFKALVTTYCDVDTDLFETFGDCLKAVRVGRDTKTVFNYNAQQYKLFKVYMENHGHASAHLSEGNVFLQVRIKPKYVNPDGSIVIPSADSEDGVFRASSSSFKPSNVPTACTAECDNGCDDLPDLNDEDETC